MATLIEKIITGALDEQQKNLFNIISSNSEISKQQINELRQSIEQTENVLEDKVARMEEDLGNIESCVQEMYDYQLDAAFIKDKLIDLVDRYENNFRINCIDDLIMGTWEDFDKELDTLFKESLGIRKVVIEREHRVKTDKNKKSNTPKTIVCRILNYKDKVKILRNAIKLQGENIFINKNFCQDTLDHRKVL